MEPTTPPTPTLRQVLLSRASLFQALIFGPVFIWLFIETAMQLYNTNMYVYDFIYDLFQAILAGGIVFIVLVQRQLPPGSLDARKAFYFELAKSLFATAAWLWLLLDAIFGPQYHRGWQIDRGRRIAATGSSVILLLILFYPTVYATAPRKDGRFAGEGGQEGDADREPLLPRSSES